jgi:hypothetical protein
MRWQRNGDDPGKFAYPKRERGRYTMSKRLDPDILVLRRCVAALDKSSSKKMVRANLEYLWDRYVAHPSKAEGRAQGGKT